MLGGFTFLILLGSISALLYWYVLNAELDKNGMAGILGLKLEEPLPEALQQKANENFWERPDEATKFRERQKGITKQTLKYKTQKVVREKSMPSGSKYRVREKILTPRPKKAYRSLDDKS